MDRKDILKTEIIMRMKHHLQPLEIQMLEDVLTEKLYGVDIIDKDHNLPATKDMTNEYIFMLYESDQTGKLSDNTITCYFDTLKEFVRYIDKPLIQITTEDINIYLMRKKKENIKNSTLNNKRRNLNTFYEWMKKKKLIEFNPVLDSTKYKEVKKPVDYMTALEMDQIRRACKSKRDRALIEYLRCTASRKGEIPNVRINQVNWMDGSIMIYGEKTSEYRTVMIDSICQFYLKEYIIEERKLDLESDEYLFTHARGDINEPLTRAGIYATVKRIASESGLKRRVYPHLFRKTTATNIVRRGGSESDAGFYLGHKPQNVTSSHYIGRTEEQRKEIFKKHVETI